MSRSFLPSRRALLASGAATGVLSLAGPGALAAQPVPTPQSWGAVPTARQLAWHEMAAYAFVHFSINTFTDREWGYGDESPALFNPTDFSADQIVGSAKAAGLTGLILTAKHHDGFCLWPSRYTEHCIRNSPYKDGRGDIVGEMAAACQRAGLRFGLYLSPWDRNHAEYGRPAYITYYRNQLRELLTSYGPLFEMWFDGANGGDGYYGGAREKRSIDAESYYDWTNTWALVRQYQPDAVVWGNWGRDSHGPWGADARWVGNEEGYAGDPCWATVGDAPYTQEIGEHGVRGGAHWRPAEVDVSLRPGWFWHAREDADVKSVGRLVRLYFESVGRGANLILNLPPDRRGRIPDHDAAMLAGWGDTLRATFGTDLAKGAMPRASATRGPGFGPDTVLDGRPDTYWCPPDAIRAADLVLEWPAPRVFDVIRLREYLPLGQRIGTFTLEIWEGDRAAWVEVTRHTAIGSQRLVRLPAPVSTTRLRLRILDADACPAIREVGLFRLPDLVEEPTIHRDRRGMVTLSSDLPGAALHYTTDGSSPTLHSPLYQDPFPLPDGGIVQALCHLPRTGSSSAVASRIFDVSKADWRIVSATAPGAGAIIDDDPGSLWVTGGAALPHSAVVDLGERRPLKGVTLLPAGQRPPGVGAPAGYRIQVSEDGKAWGPAAVGEFANIAANASEQRVMFPEVRPGRFVRLEITRGAGGEGQVAFAELGVVTR
ncbi:alpha-L-fucosidase [Nitrospirillum pindoramense]|uniref:alpha-L-fucosidase n=1 Tax=Nitrospirillum amazonense TaxID=28077 RepID=A0A560H5I6_9PROT|nr:alpha-L-fucosidase [Nitrospirillum amazonense]TWB41069.1 alpha-L-fucosidase [Nitrospirillum amazonense]